MAHSDTVMSGQEHVVISSAEKDVYLVKDKTLVGHTLGGDITAKNDSTNSSS